MFVCLQGCWMYILWDGCRSASVPRLHRWRRAPPHLQATGWAFSARSDLFNNSDISPHVITCLIEHGNLHVTVWLQEHLRRRTGQESLLSKSLNPTASPNTNPSQSSIMPPGTARTWDLFFLIDIDIYSWACVCMLVSVCAAGRKSCKTFTEVCPLPSSHERLDSHQPKLFSSFCLL